MSASIVSLPLAANGLMSVIFAALAAVAVLCFVLALAFMSRDKTDKRGNIEERLGYVEEEPVDEVDDNPLAARPDQHLAETALMQRMVGLTGRLAERAGVLERLEQSLEQADLPLRPPEALFFYLAGVSVTGLISLMVFPPGIALGLLVVVALVPAGVLHRRRSKRLRVFQEQLPATLNLLSGSMRAGFSFAQGLESVANEAEEPTRRELQRVFAESRLGRPIEDALEDSANRMSSVDLMWAVMAIRIQREVGGNLAELLDTVADTMKQRERIRGEMHALTAEGKFSGWILGIFPIAFAGVLFVVQPTYIGTLFTSPMGILACIVSGVMTFFGFLWLRKILQIEV